MADSNMYYCEKCGKTMAAENFYTSNNLEKYPNGGKMTQCKKCLTMHVDNWNPDTYTWILQEIDVPYIPEEWNKLMLKYSNEGKKITSITILGKYLSKMKLLQYKNYRWKDNEFLQEVANARIRQAMTQSGFEEADIARAIERATYELPDRPKLEEPEVPQESYFDSQVDNFDNDLTEEDRTYLRLKWGKTYRAEEWIALEQLYNEMLESYDIQAAGDINTLKLACKCSLKSNQLLDIGDIEGAQKATKMYENLMKAGKWTAAQNKVSDEEIVDSIGELVALCEKDGFIPRYYTAGPQDHVDRVLEDLQKYTQNLIANESGLSTMFETAMKQIAEEQERIKEAEQNSEEDEENRMFDYDNNYLFDDQDLVDFKDFEEELADEDEEFLKSLEEEYEV